MPLKVPKSLLFAIGITVGVLPSIGISALLFASLLFGGPIADAFICFWPLLLPIVLAGFFIGNRLLKRAMIGAPRSLLYAVGIIFGLLPSIGMITLFIVCQIVARTWAKVAEITVRTGVEVELTEMQQLSCAISDAFIFYWPLLLPVVLLGIVIGREFVKQASGINHFWLRPMFLLFLIVCFGCATLWPFIGPPLFIDLLGDPSTARLVLLLFPFVLWLPEGWLGEAALFAISGVLWGTIAFGVCVLLPYVTARIWDKRRRRQVAPSTSVKPACKHVGHPRLSGHR